MKTDLYVNVLLLNKQKITPAVFEIPDLQNLSPKFPEHLAPSKPYFMGYATAFFTKCDEKSKMDCFNFQDPIVLLASPDGSIWTACTDEIERQIFDRVGNYVLIYEEKEQEPDEINPSIPTQAG